jgi:hypothetical protein
MGGILLYGVLYGIFVPCLLVCDIVLRFDDILPAGPEIVNTSRVFNGEASAGVKKLIH